MLTHTYTITDSIAFAANTTKRIDIPKTGYITGMLLMSKIRITPATSVTPNEDALARLINAIKITAAGGKVYFDVTDGRLAFYLAYHLYQGQLVADKLPSAGGSATNCRLAIPLHFGLNPFDEFDRSVVIPAAEVDDLKISVTWGSASNLGTGYTIDSSNSEMKVTVRELTLEKGETREGIWPEGLNVPLFESREISLSSTASNLGKTDDVPVGSVLHSVLVMILNSSGNRSMSDVTEFGTKYPKLALEEYRVDDIYHIMAMNRKHYSLPGTQINIGVSGWPSSYLKDVEGVFLFPFEWVTGKAVGFDLTAAMIGDVKLGFTVAATGGKIYLLYRSIALG